MAESDKPAQKPVTPESPPSGTQPTPSAQAPVSKPVTPKSKAAAPGRRNFLKVMTVVGGILGVTPFIPFGTYFSSTVGGAKAERQRLMKTDGTFANVNEFPADSSEIFVYPRTGDAKIDAEPFRRYQLIRLSKELGGDANDISAFRAYSMVCVHLWCLWDYKEGREVEVFGEKLVGNIECPCHGSNYSVVTGKAWAGPAALQTPPNDSLPTLPLDVDADGFIWISIPDRDFNSNGIVGLGRNV